MKTVPTIQAKNPELRSHGVRWSHRDGAVDVGSFFFVCFVLFQRFIFISVIFFPTQYFLY